MTARRLLTPEHVVGFKNVADAQIAPDGASVAFVLGDSFVVDTKLPRSNVWLVSADGGEPRQLTSGPRADLRPRWSPDGATLAFLSDREADGQLQVYLLRRDGGEATRLTGVDGDIPTMRGLSSLAWSPDGAGLAFLMTDPETADEKRRKRDRDDAIEFERSPRYTRLYVVEVATGAVSCVSPAGLQVWEFCWAPSGRAFAAVVSDLPYHWAWYRCRLATFPMKGASAQTIYQTRRQVARPTWSPDGRLIAFLSSTWSDKYSVGGGVFVAPAEGGEARELAAGQVASVGWTEWASDSKTLVTAARERGGKGIAEIDVTSGGRASLWHGDVAFSEANWPQFSMDRAGNLAAVREDAAHPRDVWLARRTGRGLEWRQLTSLHPQAADLDIGPTVGVRWKGADGWEMQGLLIHPPGGASSGPRPMVTVVHGGPTSVHGQRFYAAFRWYQLLAAAGVVVFLPNPRGSTGWGLAFAEANHGDMGGKDWLDIQHGIDHLVGSGVADAGRLGIAGSSYGGFMTAWAVTQTQRFRAAVMSAGVADWRSFHGVCEIADWDLLYYPGEDPYDQNGAYARFSPITHVGDVATPTLILHGEADKIVPVEQAYQFFRALKELGVEAELVVYPREGHGLTERAHLLDEARRTVEWLVRRLEP